MNLKKTIILIGILSFMLLINWIIVKVQSNRNINTQTDTLLNLSEQIEGGTENPFGITDTKAEFNRELHLLLVKPGTPASLIERAIEPWGAKIKTSIKNTYYDNLEYERMTESKQNNLKFDVYSLEIHDSKTFFWMHGEDILEKYPFVLGGDSVSLGKNSVSLPVLINNDDQEQYALLAENNFGLTQDVNIYKLNLSGKESTVLNLPGKYSVSHDLLNHSLIVVDQDGIYEVDIKNSTKSETIKWPIDIDKQFLPANIREFGGKLAFTLNNNSYEFDNPPATIVVIYDKTQRKITNFHKVEGYYFIEGWKNDNEVWLSSSAPKDCAYSPFIAIFNTQTSLFNTDLDTKDIPWVLNSTGEYGFRTKSYDGNLEWEDDSMCGFNLQGGLEILNKDGQTYSASQANDAYVGEQAGWLTDKYILYINYKNWDSDNQIISQPESSLYIFDVLDMKSIEIGRENFITDLSQILKNSKYNFIRIIKETDKQIIYKDNKLTYVEKVNFKYDNKEIFNKVYRYGEWRDFNFVQDRSAIDAFGKLTLFQPGYEF